LVRGTSSWDVASKQRP